MFRAFAFRFTVLVLSCVSLIQVECNHLWTNGVVHYSINSKDYDAHSQDLIVATLDQLEKELCVKFFRAPTDRISGRTLYISNPYKHKYCPPASYNYSGNVVEMSIGYKCMNAAEITRIAVDMLRASIRPAGPVNSFDLVRTFQDKEHANATTLINQSDRDFINLHYYDECRALQSRREGVQTRRADWEPSFHKYYEKRLWPYGIVWYSVDDTLSKGDNSEYKRLMDAMKVIERETCIKFQPWRMYNETFKPKVMIRFAELGQDLPEHGVPRRNQTLSLHSAVVGARGHKAHVMFVLLRILGAPMMSNRFDRDNYVIINWKNVQKGKEFLLERDPKEAWPQSTRYNWQSVLHAPVNFYCGEQCNRGFHTVSPRHDYLWQLASTVGQHTNFTKDDKELIELMYKKQCDQRPKP